nr:DUF5320 family protein [Thermanaerovibrio velox]
MDGTGPVGNGPMTGRGRGMCCGGGRGLRLRRRICAVDGRGSGILGRLKALEDQLMELKGQVRANPQDTEQEEEI